MFVQANQTIAGLTLIPRKPISQTDKYYTEINTACRFKIAGLYFWGGTNVLLNCHYAYGLLQMKKGHTCHGDPVKNENYYAFGQPVTAPLEGSIVETVDGLKDNVSGEMKPRSS